MQRKSVGAITPFEMLVGAMWWVLVVSAVLLVLVTGYYTYATLAANSELFRAKLPDRFMTAAEFQRHVQNLELFTRVLLLGSVGLVVAAIICYASFTETGVLLLAVGAAFFFGMPYLIEQYGGPSNGLPKQYLEQFGNPREYLSNQYRLAGTILLGAGGIHFLISVVRYLASAPARRPVAKSDVAQAAAKVRRSNDTFLGYCWNLPFCRDTDKKLCPVRRAKSPCWRKGRGCYCDENIVLALSGGNQYAASRGSLGYLAKGAAQVSRPKTLREKREQCLGCPIYLHHQSQKYKVATPLAVLGAAGIIAYYWQAITTGYPGTMVALGRAFSGLSFSPSAGRMPEWVAAHPEWVAKVGNPAGVPEWAANLANTPGVMWMLVIVVTMLLVAYSLQLVEWTLYRLGI